MTTTTLAIPVDDETATALASASPEDKRKMMVLLGLRLQELVSAPRRPLQQIMDDMGREAAARGLTPEILESLLREE